MKFPIVGKTLGYRFQSIDLGDSQVPQYILFVAHLCVVSSATHQVVHTDVFARLVGYCGA
jgi:hypothetical protein